MQVVVKKNPKPFTSLVALFVVGQFLRFVALSTISKFCVCRREGRCGSFGCGQQGVRAVILLWLGYSVTLSFATLHSVTQFTEVMKKAGIRTAFSFPKRFTFDKSSSRREFVAGSYSGLCLKVCSLPLARLQHSPSCRSCVGQSGHCNCGSLLGTHTFFTRVSGRLAGSVHCVVKLHSSQVHDSNMTEDEEQTKVGRCIMLKPRCTFANALLFLREITCLTKLLPTDCGVLVLFSPLIIQP